MQIVINIPDEQYFNLKNNKWFGQDIIFCGESFASYIKCGTPLPKGHGRLIDAERYRKEMLDSREFNFFKTLDMQQTIIEADKAESEG